MWPVNLYVAPRKTFRDSTSLSLAQEVFFKTRTWEWKKMVRSIYLPLFLIDFDSQEGIENETEKKLLSSFVGFLQSPESAPPSFDPSPK